MKMGLSSSFAYNPRPEGQSSLFYSDDKVNHIERSMSFGQLNSSYLTNGSVHSSLESPTNVAEGFPKPAIFDLSDLTSELPNLNEPMQLYP